MTRPIKSAFVPQPATTADQTFSSAVAAEVMQTETAANAALPQKMSSKLSLQEAIRRHATRESSPVSPSFSDLPNDIRHRVLRTFNRQARAHGAQTFLTRQLAQLRSVDRSFGIIIDAMQREDQDAETARSNVAATLSNLVADFETLPDSLTLKNAVRRALQGQTHVGMNIGAIFEKSMERYDSIHKEDLLEPYASEDDEEKYYDVVEAATQSRYRIVMETLAEKTDLRTLEINFNDCFGGGHEKTRELAAWSLDTSKTVHDRNTEIQHFHLDFSCNNLTGADVASMSKLTRLTGLDLCHNNLTDANLRQLNKLTNLEFLGIRVSFEADIGLQDMTTFAQFPNLKSLRINGSDFSSNGMCSRLSHTLKNSAVSRLDISGTRYRDLDFENFIADLDLLPCLTELNMSDNFLTPAMVETLGIKLPNLKALDLQENDFSKGLTESSLANFKKLTHLNLRETSFRETDIEKLEALPKLIELDLQVNDLTTACIPMLKRLKQLKRLHFSSENFTDENSQALRAALPDVQVIISKYIGPMWA